MLSKAFENELRLISMEETMEIIAAKMIKAFIFYLFNIQTLLTTFQLLGVLGFWGFGVLV